MTNIFVKIIVALLFATVFFTAGFHVALQSTSGSTASPTAESVLIVDSNENPAEIKQLRQGSTISEQYVTAQEVHLNKADENKQRLTTLADIKLLLPEESISEPSVGDYVQTYEAIQNLSLQQTKDLIFDLMYEQQTINSPVNEALLYISTEILLQKDSNSIYELLENQQVREGLNQTIAMHIGREWAKHSPQEFISKLLAGDDKDILENVATDHAIELAFNEISKQSIEEAIFFMNKILDDDERSFVAARSIIDGASSSEDTQYAMQMLLQTNQESLISSAIYQFIEKDPRAAVDWINVYYQGDDTTDLLKDALTSFARIDYKQATNWYLSADTGETLDQKLDSLVMAPFIPANQKLNLLLEYDNSFVNEHIEGLLIDEARYNTDFAIEHLTLLDNPVSQIQVAQRIYSSIKRRQGDEAAADFMENYEFREDLEVSLNERAEKLERLEETCEDYFDLAY